jgi:uncharacterized protein YxjI
MRSESGIATIGDPIAGMDERSAAPSSHDREHGTTSKPRAGDDFWIENDAGEKAFKVNGKAFRVRDTFVLESPTERDADKVAEVSKRWFRMRDTYGIEVKPDQDDALILACTVCIDEMSRPG